MTARAPDLRLADVRYIQVEDPPPPDDDPFARLTAWQDGVVSRRQALRHMSAKVVERKLRAERWRVAWPGVYVTHLGTLTTSQQRWVAVLAAGGDLPLLRGRSPACLAGLTALQAIGLRRIESPAIFVLTGAHRRRMAPRGVIIHRTLDMPEHGDTRHVRPPATPVGRSVVDACQWARSDDEARLIVAASFQQGIVTLGHIERALEQNPGAKRARLVMRTAWDCDGGSQSLTELDLVGLCRRAGLPVPNRQVQRTDLNGRLRYLDAVYDEWRIVIEIDGLHHLYVDVMWDDADRQNALELAGFTVLRFPSFVVREHPERVAARIRQALILAGWRP